MTRHGEQHESTTLAYARTEPRSIGCATVAGVCFLLVGPLLMLGLFQLQRMPYRPPVDMSPALTSDSMFLVRVLLGIIGVLWLCVLLVIVRQGARSRS